MAWRIVDDINGQCLKILDARVVCGDGCTRRNGQSDVLRTELSGEGGHVSQGRVVGGCRDRKRV